MKHSTARGKTLYFTGQGSEMKEYGREWFSLTRHADGQRTMRVECEIDVSPVTPRSVQREVIYNTDERYYPIDCYNRLHENGKFLGAGWIRCTPEAVECETLSAPYGRYSQRVPVERPVRSLGSHPLIADCLCIPRFDHSVDHKIQHQPDFWMTSMEHDGCSGPLVGSLPLDLEYCGRETVTVPAGTFETDHYRFLITVATGSTSQVHPTEDLWCTPDEHIFVKATVGGYLDASFFLVEYSPWS
jgi:hypothetical protein